MAKSLNIDKQDEWKEVVSADSFFNYRTNNYDIQGSKLGRYYKVVHNTNAFALFDAILGGDGIQYQTADALGK